MIRQDWPTLPRALLLLCLCRTILITKLDERTLKAVSQKADTASKSSQWAISSNGKTMTRIQKVTNANGQDVDNVLVFDKQR
jgi:hypothetical protein